MLCHLITADELLFDGTIERNMAELAANQSQDGSQDHEFVNLVSLLCNANTSVLHILYTQYNISYTLSVITIVVLTTLVTIFIICRTFQSFKNDRADNLYVDDATSALASCKKFVVRPQHVLMKVVSDSSV